MTTKIQQRTSPQLIREFWLFNLTPQFTAWHVGLSTEERTNLILNLMGEPRIQRHFATGADCHVALRRLFYRPEDSAAIGDPLAHLDMVKATQPEPLPPLAYELAPVAWWVRVLVLLCWFVPAWRHR